MPPRAGIMLGMHRDIGPEGRLLGFEHLRIVADEDGLAYLASPQGREPTVFRMLEVTSVRVVFSNPDHDFPQRIIYSLRGPGVLHARVEGHTHGKETAIEWTWRAAELRSLAEPASASGAQEGGNQ